MRENRKDCKQNFEEIQEARNSLGWKIYIFLNLKSLSTRKPQNKVHSGGKDHSEDMTVRFLC